MKKVLTVLGVVGLFLVFTNGANAQFDRITLGTDFGWANLQSKVADAGSGGFNWNLHGHYGLTENIKVGLEYNTAAILAVDDDNDDLTSISGWGVHSYSAKGWYYFMTGKFKPYAGVGLGMSRIVEPDFSEDLIGKTRLGFNGNAELGLQFGGVYIAYRFHFGAKTAKELAYFTDFNDVGMNSQNFVIGYRYGFLEQ